MGKGKDKSKSNRKRGPELERERRTAEKFAGEVVEWRGKFGYIQPSEPIEHELAEKHGGKLWVSMNDISSGETELAVGALVSFHVYSDTSNTLGCEEVDVDA